MTGGARRSWRAVARQKRALWPEREQIRQRGGSRHSPMRWSDAKQLKHLFPAFALSSESQRAAPKGRARGRDATWPLLKGSDGFGTIVFVTDRILLWTSTCPDRELHAMATIAEWQMQSEIVVRFGLGKTVKQQKRIQLISFNRKKSRNLNELNLVLSIVRI